MKAFFSLMRNRLFAMPRFQRAFYIVCLCLITLYGFSLFAFSGRAFWNYVNMGIGIVMAICLLAYEFLYHEIRVDDYALLAFMFCWLALFSSLINGVGSGISKSLYTQTAFALVLFQFVKERDHLRDALLAILIGGTCFAVYYVIHYRNDLLHFNLNSTTARLGGFFDNENNVGRDFVFLGMISFYLVICKKQWWMLLYTLAMLFLALSTGSISNLLCFVVAAFIMGLIVAKGKWRWAVLGIAAGLFAVFVLLLQLPQFSYFNRRITNMLASLFGGGSGDTSANERFELARDAFLFFLDSPILGHGYNYVAQRTVGGFAHNNFAEILADYGLFALAFYETMLLLPILRLRKGKGSLEKLLLGLLTYLFIFQFFLVTYYTKLDHLVLAFAFGLVSEQRIASFSISCREKTMSMGFEWNERSKAKERMTQRVKAGRTPLDIDEYKIGRR